MTWATQWRRVVAVLGVLGVLDGAAQTHAGDVTYLVRDLGTLGGDESGGEDISESGVVVGAARAADGFNRAFRYTALGGMQALPTLGGPGISDGAGAINVHGQIVGQAVSPDPLFVGFLWDPVTGMDVLPTVDGFDIHIAHAVNDHGLVGGWLHGAGLEQTPVMWEDGKADILPTLGPGNNVVWRVNNAGRGVGFGGVFEAFDAMYWERDGDGAWTVTGLGAPPVGTEAAALGLDESGRIVGQMGNIATGPSAAFLWEDGAWTELAPLGKLSSAGAADINERGQVVGTAFDTSANQRATLWQQGTAIDLNDVISESAGIVLEVARAINDAGEITGTGTIGGETHAFLLSPDCNGNGRSDREDIDGGPVLDVAHTPDWEGNGITGGVTGAGVERDLAQTFGPVADGQLRAVRAALRRSGASALPDGETVTIQVTGVDASDRPDPANVLGAVTIPSDAIQTSGSDRMLIDFTDAGVVLAAGQTYAILMPPPDVPVGTVDWLTFSPGLYGGGRLFSRNDGGAWTQHTADLLFETLMHAPATSLDLDQNRVPDECECPDLDGNGDVDFQDLLLLLLAWGPCPACPADLDDSGAVDFQDLLRLLLAWGPCAGNV
jgi:probable HAF family extracellular repeat protein